MRTLALFAFLLFTPLLVAAQFDQLRINEVNYHEEWIEFFYPETASGMIDAATVCICSRPKYELIASTDAPVITGNTMMNPGDYLVVSWSHPGNFNTSEGEVGIYLSCSGFGNAANMIDYMQYGSSHPGTSGREDVAVTKGIWTAGTFVNLTVSMSNTLSFFNGSGGAGNWGESTATQGGPNSLLPVELTRFDAVAAAQTITLNWETATETNNAGFEVQRQVGEAFQAEGFVPGFGTTSAPQQYRYTLTEQAPGTYTFRLKQVDFDGSFDYSPEIEVQVEVPGSFHLSEAYPNPFNPTTALTLTVATSQPVTVDVFTPLGQHVQQLFSGVLAGEQPQPITFDAAGLPSGLYLIRAQGAQFTTTRQVVLMK